jgi:hypothetical protein
VATNRTGCVDSPEPRPAPAGTTRECDPVTRGPRARPPTRGRRGCSGSHRAIAVTARAARAARRSRSRRRSGRPWSRTDT